MVKKNIFVLTLIALSVFLGGCGGKKPVTSNTPVPTETPEIIPEKPIEEAIVQRPFVSLIPTSDGHRVNLKISNFPPGITGVEYELIYLADVEGNQIERGVSTGGKPVDLNGKKEYVKEILFGSASCTTGVCKYKYDENVNQGTLTLIFNAAGGKTKYESIFRIQAGSGAKEGLSTGDGKFILISQNLPSSALYLTISSVGISKPFPDGIIAKTVPYAVFSSSGTIKKGTVKIKTDLITGSIYGFSKGAWKKLETTFTDGQAQADYTDQNIFIFTQ